MFFENNLKRHLDGKNYFVGQNIQVNAEGQLVNNFLRLEQYKTCITITEWRCPACNVAELNYFPPEATKVDNAG